ncbi:MAG: Fic family protein [Patescibacteria group bacterium]|nr:Fic family protein [Patescibacteria group bacterium]
MILDQDIYQRIKEKKAKLDNLRPLPKSLVSRLHDQIIIEWTYNSNGIEGTTLSLKETRLILEHGLTIKGKPLKEHFEAKNHKDAISFVEELVREKQFDVNQLLIRQIHQLVIKEIDDEWAGKYREVEVEITGTKFVPPDSVVVPVKMRQFEKWLQDKNNQKNLIDYASLAHFKLVDIHPFIDGNGRTARLLMNLILMNRGYPPTVILKNDRMKYYESLGEGHKGEWESFVNFIGRNVERSLTWYLEAVTPSKDKKKQDKWQLLSELVKKTPYSQEYLSLLARRGKIEAVKKERNWYSNEQAIEKYRKEIKVVKKF